METNNKHNKKKQIVKAIEKEIAKVKGYTLTWVEYHLPNDKTELCVKSEDQQGNVKKLFL